MLATYNTTSKTIDVFNRNKLQDTYIYCDGKIEKMCIEKAAPKKKKAAQQKNINNMIDDFEFPF